MDLSSGSLQWNITFLRAAQDWEIDTFIDFFNPVYNCRVNGGVDTILWSPSKKGRFTVQLFSSNVVKDVVNYQTIYSKDIARSILTEGGWSNILCSGNKLQHPVDLALVFVGRELRSSDISAGKHADSAIVDLLKESRVSFTRSKFSIAFPYIAASEEETMENLLVSGFMETCGHNLGISNVTFLGSCSVEDGKFQKLADLHSVHDYLVSRSGKRQKGQADLVVFCHGGSHSSKDLDQPESESEILSELINFVEQSGAKYAALYVSDPLRSPHYPSSQELGRFLAENASGNQSANSTICDGVCQIKSSLLEGLLVAIVLLIILISGICCMMGIDTPTRFETLQET
ncbi:hypothetical protein CIPAW_13G179700 [Carya illinoinensis]|uniref:V-type proton ATPase subunit S1/VOA1 transmembrane domain-containing protein n=1 Tax=Carya illinoinensis TaxID=32201 RepID=A0A8T1NQQ9_CARIL|nr:hypothetical protein CIPAW_13G179700 [Carya illinoinensis]